MYYLSSCSFTSAQRIAVLRYQGSNFLHILFSVVKTQWQTTPSLWRVCWLLIRHMPKCKPHHVPKEGLKASVGMGESVKRVHGTSLGSDSIFYPFLLYQAARHIPEGQTIASGGESKVRTSAAPAICRALSVPVVAGVAVGCWLSFSCPPTSYWQATQHNKIHTYIKCVLLPRRTAGAAVSPRDTDTRVRRGRMLMGWTNL